MLLAVSVVSLLVFAACTNAKPVKKLKSEPIAKKPATKHVLMDSSLILKYESIGLVQVFDEGILIDLRYTTENNFMGYTLYDTIDKLFLQKEVVERLSLCQDYLDSLKPGYHLKVYDGVRPWQVQRDMWEALDSIPSVRRGKFVSNPIYGSIHNFGTAVDLTICDSFGNELDMGAGYDDFREIAFPSLEKKFLKTGELSNEQWQNRKLLRQVMRSQRFYNIPTEWWHFNAFSRMTCEKRFEILLNESGDHKVWISPPKLKDTITVQAMEDSLSI